MKEGAQIAGILCYLRGVFSWRDLVRPNGIGDSHPAPIE